MQFNKTATYRMVEDLAVIENNTDTYKFSHYNEYGSAFFTTEGKEEEIDSLFWLSVAEIEDGILEEIK